MIAALLLANPGEDLSNAFLRWIHIVAGVMWIGHLYFFNFVNAELAKTYDADSKKKVIPELMPRALFWFRWGAAWTWITGVLLLVLLYWRKANFDHSGVAQPGKGAVAVAIVLIGFLVYDQICKALSKQPMLALWNWFAIAIGFAAMLEKVEYFDGSNRAAFIHAGALFGTAMAANVWMRIWPAQKRIITAIKNGQAPDPKDPALAGMRSKHNTFMSVPLLFLMLGVHQTEAGVFGGDAWMWVLGLCVIGYFATDWLYKKAAQVKGF